MIESEEDALDQVLAGLREVEPPEGFERRGVRSVSERAGEVCGAGWMDAARVWLVSRGRLDGRGLAMAGAAALLLMVGVEFYRGGGDVGRRSSSVASSALVAPSAPAVHRGSDQVAKARRRGVDVRQGQVRGSFASLEDERRRRGRDVRRREVRREEMQGASYPAPPAPLSAEERALLRIARTGGPEEIAMLDPEIQAKREAESEAEFARFAGQQADQQKDKEITDDKQ